MTIETGDTLGRYTIQGMIGRGGMANVYKAFQPALERTVALKVMRAALTEDPEFVERFRREARAVARLEHPNIVQIYDFDEIGGHSVLAMQFLDGGTLKDRLAEAGGPLPPVEAARVVRGVADALDHAHSLDIVHRDVKPSNVMLTKAGRVVVTDFGIAKMLGSSTTQYTQTGVGVGTPDYMSPEQGQGMAIDRRSDVYALGAVAYEMLTGRVPFTAETPLAVVFKHVRDPLPRPSSLNPAIGPAIEAVLDRAMAKNPEDRYATAGAFAAALEAAVADPTRVTAAVVPTERVVAAVAAPARRALPMPLLAAGVGVLLLVGGGVAVGALVGRPAASNVPTTSPAAVSGAGSQASCTPAVITTDTQVTCTFAGLRPGASAAVTLVRTGGSAGQGPPPLTVDADGTVLFRTKLPVPGPYTLAAVSEGQTRSVQVEVLAAPAAATQPAGAAAAQPGAPTTATSAICTPPSGPSGTLFTCVFTGFPPGATLSATSQFGSSPAFPLPPPPGQTLSADPSGSWTFRTNTQGAPNGVAKVTATAGGVTLVAQYKVK